MSCTQRLGEICSTIEREAKVKMLERSVMGPLRVHAEV